MDKLALGGVITSTLSLAVATCALGVSIDAEVKSNDALNQLKDLTLKNVGTISLVANPSELKMLGLLAGTGISIERVADNAVITCTTVGQQGASGADGKKGDTGDTGDAGSSGSSGQQGVSGQQGASGSSGQQGASGSSGQQGASGESGQQGASGPSGGPPGATGASGASGQQSNGATFVCFSSTTAVSAIHGSGALLFGGSSVAISGPVTALDVATPSCAFIATRACTLVEIAGAFFATGISFADNEPHVLIIEVYGSDSAPPTTIATGMSLLHTLTLYTIPPNDGFDIGTILPASDTGLSVAVLANQWISVAFRATGDNGSSAVGYVNGSMRFL